MDQGPAAPDSLWSPTGLPPILPVPVRVPPWPWRLLLPALLVLPLVSLASCQPLEPLSAPIDSAHTVLDAAHIVLSNGDLGRLAEAVRLSTGKSIDVPVAPFSVPGTAGTRLAAMTLVVGVGQPEASLAAFGEVGFTYPIRTVVTGAALVGPGGQSCVLGIGAAQGSLGVAFRFARAPDGTARLILAGEPTFAVQGGGLHDPSGCLQGAATGALDAITAQLRGALRAALEERYVATARAVLEAVLPSAAEIAGDTLAGAGHGPRIRLRSAYTTAAGSSTEAGPLLQHNGNFASATLSIAMDAERHPCAIDAPPPALAAAPLAATIPPSPAGSFLLRRALVVDRALLSHLLWTAQRAGLLCRRVPLSGKLHSADGWGAAGLSALAGWVRGPPTRARLWSGGSPSLELLDRDGGAGVRLKLPAATLEVAAEVADVEAVVLRVRGMIVLELRVAVGPLKGAGLVIDRLRVEGAVVRSPLRIDLDPPPAAFDPWLSRTLTATLAGALDGLVLPAFSGASVVAGSRVGSQLWLWLEEAPPAGG